MQGEIIIFLNLLKKTLDVPSKLCYTVITVKEHLNESPRVGGERSNMEEMTDRQLNFIVSLIIDKLESCKDMDEIKKALEEIKGMLKKEKAND